MVRNVESMNGIRRLRHVVFESSHHLLHRLPHLRRAEWLPREIGSGLARAPRIAIRHHDDHRLRFARGNQIIEDEVRLALPRPPGFVFTAAVLEVEHGVALFRMCVVGRRRVDHRVPPRAGHLRVIPDFAHLPVRNILRQIIRRTRFGDLDRAGPLASAKVGRAPRIAHFGAVHDDHIVVEARRHRGRGKRPESVGLFLHLGLRTAPEIHPDFTGVRRLEADLHA